MSNTDNWVVVGRFGKVHGVKGLITIHSFTEPKDNILQYPVWHVFIDNQWKPIKLISKEITNKHLLVKVEGYSERDQAANLTNIEIGIEGSYLPQLQPGEYYWHQLIGMQVVNKQGDKLGYVVEIIPTGSNDVLVVEGEKRQLIPYLPEHSVLEVNVHEQQIIVDWDADF